MITTIILFMLSVLLEGIIPNVLRNVTPFFVIAVIVIWGMNFKNQRLFYYISFIFGVLYDVIYNNTLFLTGFIYVLIAFLCFNINGKKKYFIKVFFTYLLMCLLYIIIMVLFTFSYNQYNFKKVSDILCDGLIINVIYFLFIYLIYIVINCIFGHRLKKSSY